MEVGLVAVLVFAGTGKGEHHENVLALPSTVTPSGGFPLKQNIFEQAFTWYPIRRSIPNTTQNIQVINSSDFSETPGSYLRLDGQKGAG